MELIAIATLNFTRLSCGFQLSGAAMYFSQPSGSERADSARAGETRRDYFKLVLLMVLSLLPTAALPAWVEAESTIGRAVPNSSYISAMYAAPHHAMIPAAESVQRPRMIRVRRLKPLQHRSPMMARSAARWAQFERVLQTGRLAFVNPASTQPVVFDGHSSLPPPLGNACPQRILAPSEILSSKSLTARAGSLAPETPRSAAPHRAKCAPGTLSQIPACTPS
jgi:hypothetical protein